MPRKIYIIPKLQYITEMIRVQSNLTKEEAQMLYYLQEKLGKTAYAIIKIAIGELYLKVKREIESGKRKDTPKGLVILE